MHKLRLIFGVVYLLLVTASWGLTVPKQADHYINDYAHLLTPTVAATLNSQLQQFEKQTTTQIVVAIFPSLKNDSLEDFTTRLETQWQVGQKGRDNGILMVIFVKEHQVRIEVGYGLESVIPDALAGQIIQTDIVPNFKAGHYEQGLAQALTSLMQLAKTTNLAPVTKKNHSLPIAYYFIGGFLLLIAFSFFVKAFKQTAKNDTYFPANTTIQPQSSPLTPKQQKWASILSFLWILLAFLPRGGGGSGRNDDDSFKGGGGRSGGGGANGQW
jgi:uncharacterized protein